MDHELGPTRAFQGALASLAIQEASRPTYCLYARKSSEAEERQALSIDSQVKEMLAIAERDNLEVIDIRREAHSAKDSGQRPVFKELLEDIRRGRFNAILTWNPDRLSRNAGDLGSLVDLMDQKVLLEIRTHGQIFTNSPNEKFLLMILCSQAKLENDNKGVNVKRGLKMRCEMGLWPAPAPTGYLSENRADRRGYVMIDPERGHIIKQMFERVAYEKWSGRKLYHWLRFELNFRSAYGNKHLTLSNIYLILKNTFYYGTYEYPRKSGNWYTGKHQPLITKELFDQVQSQITSQKLMPLEPKDFAFVKLLYCGLCGSGITAQEKHKKLKNGDISSHIYYSCTRARDKNCTLNYINEQELIIRLQKVIDQINLDEIGMRDKIEQEIKRYNAFGKNVLEQDEILAIKEKDISTRNYAKYILRQGTIIEKRELISSLKNKLFLKPKEIVVEESTCLI